MGATIRSKKCHDTSYFNHQITHLYYRQSRVLIKSPIIARIKKAIKHIHSALNARMLYSSAVSDGSRIESMAFFRKTLAQLPIS